MILREERMIDLKVAKDFEQILEHPIGPSGDIGIATLVLASYVSQLVDVGKEISKKLDSLNMAAVVSEIEYHSPTTDLEC